MQRLLKHFQSVNEALESILGYPVAIYFCPLADEQHEKSWRIHAHTIHIPSTICVAEAILELPEENIEGILWHEAGHLLLEEFIPEANRLPSSHSLHHVDRPTEILADEMTEAAFGITIGHDENELQVVL